MEPLLNFLHDIFLLHCPFNMTQSTIPWPSFSFYLVTVLNGLSFPYNTYFTANPCVTSSVATLSLLIFLSRLPWHLALEFMVYGFSYLCYWYGPNVNAFMLLPLWSIFCTLQFAHSTNLILGYRSGGPGSIPGTTRKKSNGSGTGSTQPREYNWGATW
jgi:hypothetical protein